MPATAPRRSTSRRTRRRPRTPFRYAERLALPWWCWPPALGAAALLAAEIHLGAPGLRSWVPYLVLLPGTAAALVWFGRLRVAVSDDTLLVDDARLPVRFVAGATALSAQQRRDLLGAAADPLAFVVQRPWVPGAVRVDLDDPADPTPYWLVSSRNPAALVAALQAARS